MPDVRSETLADQPLRAHLAQVPLTSQTWAEDTQPFPFKDEKLSPWRLQSPLNGKEHTLWMTFTPHPAPQQDLLEGN
jgi:hypothetical protein